MIVNVCTILVWCWLKLFAVLAGLEFSVCFAWEGVAYVVLYSLWCGVLGMVWFA